MPDLPEPARRAADPPRGRQEPKPKSKPKPRVRDAGPAAGDAGLDRGLAHFPPGEAEHVRAFLAHLDIERGLSPNTLLAYRRDLADARLWLGIPVWDADAELLQAYLRCMTKEGAATRTVSRRLAAIRTFLKWAHYTLGHDTEAVLQMLDRPKPEKSLPKTLTRYQTKKVVTAPISLPKPDGGDGPLGVRDRAILELLYACGLRATELCELTLVDLDLMEGELRVVGKGRKERVVPIGDAARDTLDVYLTRVRPALAEKATGRGEPEPRPVFLSNNGRPLDRVRLWQLVKAYAARCGLMQKVSPHVLRHCFATHLVSGGADLRIVQELLGHADVGTTQVYTSVDADRLKHTHTRFHPRA